MSIKLTTPPDVLYLQFHGDGDPEEQGHVYDEDVTWCVDRIYDQDIEYRRVPTEQAEVASLSRLDRLIEALEIFKKYSVNSDMNHKCDTLLVTYQPADVEEVDRQRLQQLLHCMSRSTDGKQHSIAISLKPA